MIKLENADVGYNKKVVIKNVEFEAVPGEIITLIGPNGSGKSTILKTILKELKLLGGAVYLEGRNIKNETEKTMARSMSMVLTERIKTELMSCRDVAATGRYPYTNSLGTLTEEDERIISEALARVDAQDIADEDFMKISDGQRQRVMLARALCQRPKVLILDEPTSYLDMRYKLALLNIIRELATNDNITIVMSLHELDLARRISDKIVCIKDGGIDKVDTPENVFRGNYIEQLFGVAEGSYDSKTGSMELPRVEGEPRIFVIGGGGSGIDTYYILQRKKIPFAAGILYQNDIEYSVARNLAAKIVEQKSFTKMSNECYDKAVEIIDTCESVICTIEEFGELNAFNDKLLNYAKMQGKLVKKI